MGLEEVFESTDAGGHWVTASPYWNYGLPCASTTAGCPNTTHPDQHALMIADGKVVEGNDGGVYSRPLSDTQQYGDWTDLNATHRTWQYYDARAGRPRQRTGHLGRPAGQRHLGARFRRTPDGRAGRRRRLDVIVDPANANRMLGEYTDGAMYSTTDGGHTFYDPVSPGCVAQATIGRHTAGRLRPSLRFVAPMAPDART